MNTASTMNRLPLMTRALTDTLAVSEGQAVSVAQFINQAQILGARLGDCCRVINLCQDRHVFSLSFAASLLTGRTTLLPANRLPATVDALLRQYPDSLIICENPIAGLAHATIDPTPCLKVDGRVSNMPNIDAELLAAVVYTSGSTGPSSSIRKPWLTLYESSRINACEYGPAKPGTHILATVPAQHMWGLETSVLMPWFSPVVMVSGQPFFAADILEQLRSLPQPCALVSTPVHLRNLAESGLDLAPLDLIYSATAPLSSRLAADLEARTGARVIEVFGCSEAGCLARRRAAHDEPWQLFAAFTLNRLGQHHVVDADHLPQPVTLLDHLIVERDGRFRLAGRNGDLVNIAGKRASLIDLTQALLDINGVIDGVIFQPGDNDTGSVKRLAALVVAPDLSAAEIRAELACRIDAAFMPRPLRLVEALPRAESGKLPRQSLVHLFKRVCEPAG